ncbi:MAG: hypothetical protein HQM12_11510 [SAR324 cluster bacterium]|nr:hypothetical protein [SAR324 cluster bacterium]
MKILKSIIDTKFMIFLMIWSLSGCAQDPVDAVGYPAKAPYSVMLNYSTLKLQIRGSYDPGAIVTLHDSGEELQVTSGKALLFTNHELQGIVYFVEGTATFNRQDIEDAQMLIAIPYAQLAALKQNQEVPFCFTNIPQAGLIWDIPCVPLAKVEQTAVTENSASGNGEIPIQNQGNSLGVTEAKNTAPQIFKPRVAETPLKGNTAEISFEANDDSGLEAYCVQESSASPKTSDSCWVKIDKTPAELRQTHTITLSDKPMGTYTTSLMISVRDAQQVSASALISFTRIVPDTLVPVIHSVSFNEAKTITGRDKIPVSLTLEDNCPPAALYISEQDKAPTLEDEGWITPDKSSESCTTNGSAKRVTASAAYTLPGTVPLSSTQINLFVFARDTENITEAFPVKLFLSLDPKRIEKVTAGPDQDNSLGALSLTLTVAPPRQTANLAGYSLYWSNNDGNRTLINYFNTPGLTLRAKIMAGMTTLRVYPVYFEGEYSEFVTLSVADLDMGPPVRTEGELVFNDLDTRAGMVGGNLSLNRESLPAQTTGYRIYRVGYYSWLWSDIKTTSWVVPFGTPFYSKDEIRVYAYNAYGQSAHYLVLRNVDR